MAHAHGVKQSISMRAVESVLVSPILSIARGAHVLGVMLSVDVWALGDGHHVGFLTFLITDRWFFLFKGLFFGFEGLWFLFGG